MASGEDLAYSVRQSEAVDEKLGGGVAKQRTTAELHSSQKTRGILSDQTILDGSGGFHRECC